MDYPTIVIFTINVFAFAIPIAFLEIFIEKDKGWGAGLSKEKWYGKIVGKNNPFMKLLAKIVGVPYFFGYGIFMFFFLVPSLLLVEHFLIVHNLPLLFAVYFGISVVEDFLWFVFNWHFPAFRELLKGPKGSIWWHQRWVKIFNGYYLPASYFTGFAIVILFLLVS